MLEPEVVELATGPNYVAFTTLLPDGSPMTHLTWVGADGDRAHLLVNTEVHRAKARNVARDPRVTVLLFAHDDFYRWAEVRGRVVEEIRGDRARAHIDELARKYTGRDYATPIRSERVILRIEPTRQVLPGR